MAKSVILSLEAEIELSQILDFVAEYTYILSSKKLLDEFLEKFEYIGFLPKSYKLLGNVTRETFCRSYRIAYEETDDYVQILTVIHSRRKYPQDK